MSLYSDRDSTLEKLVDLLVRTTNERDEALERCRKLNEQVFGLMMERRGAPPQATEAK